MAKLFIIIKMDRDEFQGLIGIDVENRETKNDEFFRFRLFADNESKLTPFRGSLSFGSQIGQKYTMKSHWFFGDKMKGVFNLTPKDGLFWVNLVLNYQQ